MSSPCPPYVPYIIRHGGGDSDNCQAGKFSFSHKGRGGGGGGGGTNIFWLCKFEKEF